MAGAVERAPRHSALQFGERWNLIVGRQHPQPPAPAPSSLSRRSSRERQRASESPRH
jgi:hypothetical protein